MRDRQLNLDRMTESVQNGKDEASLEVHISDTGFTER